MARNQIAVLRWRHQGKSVPHRHRIWSILRLERSKHAPRGGEVYGSWLSPFSPQTVQAGGEMLPCELRPQMPIFLFWGPPWFLEFIPCHSHGF